ncbi:MAG: chemotaxis protein CheA [Terriglobia bacterium]
MSENDEILKDFFIESTEKLDQLDRDLLALEKGSASRETLDNIFRSVHTIKGNAGFFGFTKLELIAHSGENLLSRLRSGKLSFKPEIVSGLLAMVDAVREILATAQSTGREGDQDHQQLIETLQRLQESQVRPRPLESVRHAVYAEPQIDPDLPVGEILVQSGRVSQEEIESALEAQRAGDPRHIGEILVERGIIPPAVIREILEAQRRAHASDSTHDTIRVGVARLDRLMNLVGELNLVRDQIARLGACQQDTSTRTALERLNRIVEDLQEAVMKTRMQSLDQVWSKFPRIVRDLAIRCGKQIRLELAGAETELDRTIIEAIKDPFTHIVRNAVDHGIERPEERSAAGKPPEGRLSLLALRRENEVEIEISDDGAGIDLDDVKRMALERGLITSRQAATMGERETLNLLFVPGFSTAAKITNISGRGVGLDVVKTNVEMMGGTVDVESKLSEGTTLRMKIPLTLAVFRRQGKS